MIRRLLLLVPLGLLLVSLGCLSWLSGRSEDGGTDDAIEPKEVSSVAPDSVPTPNFGSVAAASGPSLTHRWIFVRQKPKTQNDTNTIRRIVTRAAKAGYTGVVWDCDFDYIKRFEDNRGRSAESNYYFEAIADIKQTCAAVGLEIIPAVFMIAGDAPMSIGGDSLSAALPVKKAVFVVNDGVAEALKNERVANPGLEERNTYGGVADWRPDKPNQVSFIDTEVYRSGTSSIRLQYHDEGQGMGRMWQSIDVDPFRTYRFSCYMKVTHPMPSGKYYLTVFGGSSGTHYLMRTNISGATRRELSRSGWVKVTTAFNSLHYSAARIYVGLDTDRSPAGAALWIDDISVQPAGLVNVVERTGARFVVRSTSGTEYVRGRDYERIVDKGPDNRRMDFRYARPDLPLEITADSRIDNGEILELDYYQGVRIHGLPSVCPEHPAFDAFCEHVVQSVHDLLQPRAYFINMSELYISCWCERCSRHSGAKVIGDWISRQVDMIHEIDPGADVYVWSDMLDPHHNANPNYYLFRDNPRAISDYIDPSDVTVVCWRYSTRTASLSYFDQRGFRTIAGAYYDHGDMTRVGKWIHALYGTQRGQGIMYTTWRGRYESLELFAELVEAAQIEYDTDAAIGAAGETPTDKTGESTEKDPKDKE